MPKICKNWTFHILFCWFICFQQTESYKRKKTESFWCFQGSNYIIASLFLFLRTTVQGATFNMCGQLYRGHANATAFSSSPVVSALGSEADDPGASPSWGKALCP